MFRRRCWNGSGYTGSSGEALESVGLRCGWEASLSVLECLFFRDFAYDSHNRTAVGKNSRNLPRFRKLARPFCRSFQVGTMETQGECLGNPRRCRWARL